MNNVAKDCKERRSERNNEHERAALGGRLGLGFLLALALALAATTVSAAAAVVALAVVLRHGEDDRAREERRGRRAEGG